MKQVHQARGKCVKISLNLLHSYVTVLSINDCFFVQIVRKVSSTIATPVDAAYMYYTLSQPPVGLDSEINQGRPLIP